MKPGQRLLLWLLLLSAFSFPASAAVYTGEVHTTVTVNDTYYWSGIDVGDGQTVEYTVSVTSGDRVNVHLMDDTKLTLFLLGSTVPTVHSNEDTTSASYSHSAAGKYALIIDNGFGTSVCKVDIVVRSANFWETGAGCILIIVVVVIIGIAVIAVVVTRIRRTRPPAPQPPQFGPPAPQYGAPAYTPPPIYPSVQNQVPAPGYREQAGPAPAAPPPSSAPYQPAPQQVYQPPPVPPAYGQQTTQQYPMQAPFSPAGPPAPPPAAASTVACKYCMMEVPASITVCPRCGGFM